MQRPNPPSAPQDWWWIFDPRFSLRARSALIVGVGTIGFVALINWIAGTALQRSLERQAGANFETLAFQLSDKLDRVLQQRSHELQLAAGLGPFRTAGAPAAERRLLLESLQNGSPDFVWVGLADTSGQVTAATRKIFEGTSVEARPWFRHGRERPFMGNLAEFPALARERLAVGIECASSAAGGSGHGLRQGFVSAWSLNAHRDTRPNETARHDPNFARRTRRAARRLR